MTEIKATVFSKTGEKTNFVYNCADVDGKPSLKEIHKSSVQLQQELNKFLTTLVEKEKSKTGMHSAVFNVSFNNISAISWCSILLVEATRIPIENHKPAVSH
jgi:hypothetical protein